MAIRDDWLPLPGFFVATVQKLDEVADSLGSTVVSVLGAAMRLVRQSGNGDYGVVPLSIAHPGYEIGNLFEVARTVELRTEDDGVVVLPSGAFDDEALPYLREKLVAALSDYTPCVFIDLTKVDRLGSSGIDLLVLARERVGQYGGFFSVRCGHTGTRRMFEDHGVMEVLNVDYGK